MSVEVRLPTVLRSHAGGNSIVIALGSTVGEVLDDLSRNYPDMKGRLLGEDGSLHRFVNVYVNDDDVRYLNQLDTRVADGDTISILPAVAGGES
ncbi:MAG: ubiquitin-like small modifier protein 1 [Acidimicrobiales bacterium]